MTPRLADGNALGILLRDAERVMLIGVILACLAGGSLVLLVGLLVAIVGSSLSTFTGGLPGLGVLPSSALPVDLPRARSRLTSWPSCAR
jgi:hypothetical protein